MPKFPIRVPRPVLTAIAALLLAILTTAGAIQAVDDPSPAPTVTPPAAPAATVARSSWGTPAPHATPTAGEHDLNESGDVDLGTLRGATPTGSSDTLPGCTSRFNTHNYSARTRAIREIVPHYTVSPNRPGWADVLGVAAGLNDPARLASASLIIDAEGNCLYTVPLKYKAWTEVNGNGFSASIEFVATGTEGKLSAKAIARGGQVIDAIAKREQIPIQTGDVTGCSPNRPGLADHAMFGSCGGCHYDLRPFYNTRIPTGCAYPTAADNARVLAPLLAAARSAGVTTTDRVTCRKLVWWREHGRPHGLAETRAVRRRKALTARGVTCTNHGPVLSAA